MSSFPPKPGTVAYRVLAHLETLLPRRPRATAGMIAGELSGVTPGEIRDALEAAHAAGYVNRSADHGPSARGPVFYELVRKTTGDFATRHGPTEGGWITSSGDPSDEPSGVIEPVVDPHPDAAPILDAHDPAARPLSKMVAIRPTSDGAEVEIARTPELAAWLRDKQQQVAHSAAVAEVVPDDAATPPVAVSLDFAAGDDQFAAGDDQFAVALASDGRLHCWRGVVPYVFSKAEARALVDYLNRIDLEPILEGEA